MPDTVRRIVFDASTSNKAAGDVVKVEGAVARYDKAAAAASGTSDKLGDAVKGLVSGYLGPAGLIAVLGYSVNQAMGAETAQRRLTTALGYNSKALIEYSAARQEATTFDDDGTVAAMAAIAAFTNEESVIKRITVAAQDMAEAKGTDLVSAADLVSKSIYGNANALARYGVEAAGAAGSTERLSAVLDGIEKKWGGQAVSAILTDTGKIKQVKNEVDDMAQELGEFFLPALVVATRGMRDFYKEWVDLPGKTRAANEYVSNELIPSMQHVAAVAFDPRWDGSDFKGVYAWLKRTSTAFETMSGSAAKARADAEWTAKWDREHDTSGPMGPNIDEDLLARRDAAQAAADDRRRQRAEVAAAAEKKIQDEQIAYYVQTQLAYAEVTAKYTVPIAIEDNDVWIEAEKVNEETWRREHVAFRELKDKEKELIERNRQLQRIATVNMAADAVGALAMMNQAFRGNALFTKRLMQGQVAMSTAAAIMGALDDPGPFLANLANAGIAAGMGAAQIATINAQRFARGTDFITGGPQLIMVGENPGRRERVTVEPLSSPNYEGPRSGGVNIYINAAYVDSDAVPRLAAEVERRMKRDLA